MGITPGEKSEDYSKLLEPVLITKDNPAKIIIMEQGVALTKGYQLGDYKSLYMLAEINRYIRTESSKMYQPELAVKSLLQGETDMSRSFLSQTSSSSGLKTLVYIIDGNTPARNAYNQDERSLGAARTIYVSLAESTVAAKSQIANVFGPSHLSTEHIHLTTKSRSDALTAVESRLAQIDQDYLKLYDFSAKLSQYLSTQIDRQSLSEAKRQDFIEQRAELWKLDAPGRESITSNKIVMLSQRLQEITEKVDKIANTHTDTKGLLGKLNAYRDTASQKAFKDVKGELESIKELAKPSHSSTSSNKP